MDHSVISELEVINKDGADNELTQIKEAYIGENHVSPLKRQGIVSFGVFLLTVSVGSTLGISAIIIPQLKNVRSDITVEVMSWIASISSLGQFFGNVISGFLMEKYGRRLSHLMLATCFVIGWIIISISNDILYLLLLGRFITGFSQGWLGPVGPVFVGEISTPTYRGIFLAFLSFGIAVGVLLAHLLGTIFHWTVTSLLCGLFPLVGGIIIWYAPESPVWLASCNKMDESVLSFQWYRGRGLAMNIELQKMLKDIKNENSHQLKIDTLRKNISKPEFYKPLFIMMVFFIMSVLSGVNVVSAYATDMMEELAGSERYTYITMLIMDILRCVSLAVACYLVRIYPQRPMALYSGLFTSISLILLAFYLYMCHIGVILFISPFISLGLMAIYIIVSHMGVVLLPWNMVGEIFSVETKGLGSVISVMVTAIADFGVMKSAPAAFLNIGHHGTYLLYGISTLCGTIYLFFYLPEVKNKTLLQVVEHFRYGREKNNQMLP